MKLSKLCSVFRHQAVSAVHYKCLSPGSLGFFGSSQVSCNGDTEGAVGRQSCAVMCTAGYQALLTVLLGHAESLQRYYCFWVPLLFITQLEAPQQESDFWEAVSSCLCKLAAWLGSCLSFLPAGVSHPLSALRSKRWLLCGMDCGTCGESCLSVLTLRSARPFMAA